MSDLSYTNKDGLNPAAGFTNVYNYHRDAASGAAGYAHGGYPEVTGETSPYKDTSYKTGDKTDFFDNGNTFDIITGGGGGGGNKIEWKFIYAYCTTFNVYDETLTYDLGFAINPTTESDWTVYENQTFVEYKPGYHVLGNTNLIPSYVGYTGESMHTDWSFCLLRQPVLGEFTTNPEIVVLVSPELYDQNWNVRVGADTVIGPLEPDVRRFYDEQFSRFEAYEIFSGITSEQLNILKDHNGQEIKVMWNNEVRTGTVDYSEDEEGGWFNICLYEPGSAGDEIYNASQTYAVAGVYLYYEPFPYELGQEITVYIDFDDLEPTA